MRSARWIAGATVLSCSVLLPPAIGWAQGSPADYARAELFRALGPEGLVSDAPDSAVWLPTGDRFWYRKTMDSGQAFVLVDATTLTKGPAFDHVRLGAALTAAMRKPITAVNLPFRRFTFADSGRSIEFTEGSGRPGPAVVRDPGRTESVPPHKEVGREDGLADGFVQRVRDRRVHPRADHHR